MQPNKQKAEVCGRYKNIHTGEMCTVTSKYFSTVEYKYDDGFQSSTHYETFNKNWVQMMDRDSVLPKCRKCGMDCNVIGGSQWLGYACEKKNRVEDED